MKKNILLITICICVTIIGIKTNVYAAASAPDNGSSNTNLAELKNGYNNSNPTLNVKSKGFVTIYAKSECDPSTKKCTYQYQGLSVGESADKLLERAVKCENGESYISYNADNVQSGGSDVKDEWKNPLATKTTIYWSEDYYITCSNTAPAAGSGQVSLGSSGSSNNSSSTGSSSNSGDTSSSVPSSSSNQNYNSSTTVDNSATGIETYYIVLAIIAVVAYALMFFVKKYNLFKNI